MDQLMKNYFVLLFSALLIMSFGVLAKDKPIVSQGEISVTFDDVDGYAQKIPSKDRSNFFFSVQRIDKTVYNLLNMKHIVNYGNDEDIIDRKAIDKSVTERIIYEYDQPEKASNILMDKNYLLFKNFLILEESYKYMLRYVRESVKAKELMVLAEEQYFVNKDSYFREESRDISYFSILYNIENKDEIQKRTYKLIKELEANNNIEKFKENHNNEPEITVTMGLEKFKYNVEFKDFSDYVFTPKKTGTIQQPLDAKNRFIVVVIDEITKQYYVPFNDVKDDLIKVLVKDKAERDFRELLLRLTQSPVEINKQALVDLKTRYIN